MHQFPILQPSANYQTSFNSLCLGFFHAPNSPFSPSTPCAFTFNSLCLGFFHAPSPAGWIEILGLDLSIPFAWDFSMHHLEGVRGKERFNLDFQFPLLGIFPCTFFSKLQLLLGYCFVFQFPLLGIFPCTWHMTIVLSLWLRVFQFPLLGIFPCTLLIIKKLGECIVNLSIPFAWDFSMHLAYLVEKVCEYQASFNSLCLGFFHAPHQTFSLVHKAQSTFNSLCLGFFHAPVT